MTGLTGHLVAQLVEAYPAIAMPMIVTARDFDDAITMGLAVRFCNSLPDLNLGILLVKQRQSTQLDPDRASHSGNPKHVNVPSLIRGSGGGKRTGMVLVGVAYFCSN